MEQTLPSMETELLYLRDAHLRSFEATVTAVDAEGGRVVLDRTAFYPTGGGRRWVSPRRFRRPGGTWPRRG